MQPSNRPDRSGRDLHVAVYFLAIAVTSLATFQALGWHLAPKGPVRIFMLALSLWFSGVLWRVMMPGSSLRATLSRSTSFAAIVALGFGLLAGMGDLPVLLALVAITVLIFVILDVVVTFAGGHAKAGTSVFGLFLLIASAPAWLAPYFAGHPRLLDAVITTNPLVYLAVQADIDLFRMDAIYAMSPIGGIRYSYPSPQLALLATFGVVLALLAALQYRQRIGIPR